MHSVVPSHNQLGMENDIRECLSRLLRLESSLATLTVNANAAQSNQWNVVNQLQGALHQISNQMSEQRDMFVSIKNDVSASRSPHAALKEPSPEVACGFPHCTFQLGYAHKRPCSAVQSLRHMRLCAFCPDGQCRYLAIAQHMMLFRSPRQHHSHIDNCCWCGGLFTDLIPVESDKHDKRANHRKTCLQTTILNLQSAERHDATVALLVTIWDRESECLTSLAKRGRAGLSPVLVPIGVADRCEAARPVDVTDESMLLSEEEDGLLGQPHFRDFSDVEFPL